MTFLFVPAHDERKVEKAFKAGATDIILDLEDSVPEDHKAAARRAAHRFVADADTNTPVWVRVNVGGTLFEDDLRSLDWSRLAGAVLPKAERPSDVEALERAGAQQILLLIESATGLDTLPALARSSARVTRAALGTWDLSLDLGLPGIDDPDDSELMWQLRGDLVVRSRALRLQAPIDGVYAALDDDDGLAAVCDRAFRLGYAGKLVIHPRQVPIVESVFEPDPDALELANETIAAYERAAATGHGAVRVRGRLVDRPMVERARALAARTSRVRR